MTILSIILPLLYPAHLTFVLSWAWRLFGIGTNLIQVLFLQQVVVAIFAITTMFAVRQVEKGAWRRVIYNYIF